MCHSHEAHPHGVQPHPQPYKSWHHIQVMLILYSSFFLAHVTSKRKWMKEGISTLPRCQHHSTWKSPKLVFSASPSGEFHLHRTHEDFLNHYSCLWLIVKNISARFHFNGILKVWEFVGVWILCDDGHIFDDGRLLSRTCAKSREVASPWVAGIWEKEMMLGCETSIEINMTSHEAYKGILNWCFHLFHLS